jgi:hypothetical protein
MAFSVELMLDSEGDAGVRRLWDALEVAGVPSLATTGHHQHVPHISLTVCNELDVESATAALADAFDNRRGTDLTLGFAGAFPGPPPVVFAGVVSTDDLLALQHTARAAIRACASSVWEYYLPDRWVPHCTLAMPVRPDQVGLAIDTVLQAGVPLTGRAAAIGIAEVGTGDLNVVAKLH